MNSQPQKVLRVLGTSQSLNLFGSLRVICDMHTNGSPVDRVVGHFQGHWAKRRQRRGTLARLIIQDSFSPATRPVGLLIDV
jgi:hypothetical protein